MFIAIGIMIKGIYDKYKWVTAGEGDLLPENLNWKNFMNTVFLQERSRGWEESAFSIA